MRFIIKIFLLIIGLNVSLFAQEEEQEPPSVPPQKSGEFWFSPSAEIALYSKYTFSYGAGFTIAYGKKVSFGLKASFLFDEKKALDVLELHFLLRLYVLKGAANRGPFFQIAGGPAIFFPREHEITLPAKIGMISAGLGFGWRFLFKNIFFIEPQVRGGYPFIVEVLWL